MDTRQTIVLRHYRSRSTARQLGLPCAVSAHASNPSTARRVVMTERVGLTVHCRNSVPAKRGVYSPPQPESWVMIYHENSNYRIVQTQVFTLEPAYPIETGKVDDYTREVVDSTPNGVFYHVTFSNLVPKIMIRGLVPSNQKRNMFDHPDRTYLFKNLKSAKRFANYHTVAEEDEGYGTLEHERKINTRWIGNTKGKDTPPERADDAYQHPNPGVIIFSVDVVGMLEDSRPLKLYHDNRYEPVNTAFFTTNSIPPRYLKQVDFQRTRPT